MKKALKIQKIKVIKYVVAFQFSKLNSVVVKDYACAVFLIHITCIKNYVSDNDNTTKSTIISSKNKLKIIRNLAKKTTN